MRPAIPRHGGQLQAIADEFGVAASDLLDFSANINPDGPPAGVLPALRSGLDNPVTLGLYPDLDERKLKRSIARYAGVEERQIAVANGFVPLLEAALKHLPIGRCVLPVPAFTEYRAALARTGVEVLPHLLSASEDFRYDADALLQGDHDAILLANPQNPSGVCASYASVIDLVMRAASRDMFVLLDEAFIDFAPQESLAAATARLKNLIVFRSVTKFHGMPGLRVAYCVANAELSASLSEELPPWPITTLAARGVCAALADSGYVSETMERTVGRREVLVAGLGVLGLEPHPSSANFLLFQLPAGVEASDVWRQLIENHRIVVRDCSNYEGLPANYLRVAVRTGGENERLLRALQRTLGR